MKIYQLDISRVDLATLGAKASSHFGTRLGMYPSLRDHPERPDRIEEAEVVLRGSKMLLEKPRGRPTPGIVLEVFASSMPHGIGIESMVVVAMVPERTKVMFGGGDGYDPRPANPGKQIVFSDPVGMRRGAMVTMGGHAENANGAIVKLVDERDEVAFALHNVETGEKLAEGTLRLIGGRPAGLAAIQKVLSDRIAVIRAAEERIAAYEERGEILVDPVVSPGEIIPAISAVEWRHRLFTMLRNAFPRCSFQERDGLVFCAGNKRYDPVWGAFRIGETGAEALPADAEEVRSRVPIIDPHVQWEKNRVELQVVIDRCRPLSQIPRDFVHRPLRYAPRSVAGRIVGVEWFWRAIEQSVPDKIHTDQFGKFVRIDDLTPNWFVVCPWLRDVAGVRSEDDGISLRFVRADENS